MKKVIYFLATISIVLSSCSSKQNEEVNEQEEAKFCLNAQLKKTTGIEPVTEKPVHEQLTLSGKVEYNENDLVAFKSLLQGTVDKVNFELGDYVKQGQVLAIVRSNDVIDLMQQKRSYQNQADLAQKQIKTKRELVNDGLASQPEVTEIEHELQSARIEVEKINSTLRMYRAVGNGQFQIIAPKNGYIVQKNISAGQSITADDSENLFSISNLNQVWVMVNIYANNLQYVKKGDVVKVRTMAYPDKIYSGTIDRIDNVFDENEHVLKARVVLENQDLNLIPGLSADIIIDKKNILRNAYAIPNKAKIFENNKEYVVVYKDDCKMEIRKITTIGQNEEYTFVDEKFAPNDKVITNNALLIYAELNK
ncbi:membrane fusion protein, cobalt-zinc-cadmium efflux system [Chishuiella changwenlii]|jgi:cobalt-zinc-cadmium efflux system membrane fusion protein|uniref:Macrolide transporter subunit MacA n=1 Tax=Chishuiella changwenlii TaxID=1434701 RepID=A0A1M6VCH9_9FLAO|nr:efflux RND transporter periplasmic adaptor subunit [Chishuiella changwenlii]GGF09716.1 macrolide transporter subunit MacA [Chishuiella changwenlii]SHK79148.1 membrane fusion protein, cobalt-zinc-cadmium efflux system [Chishuiella changwenlii]